VYVAAVDSSGNLEYVGVVVGEEKDMRRLLSRLLTEFPVIHMRELSRAAKERLARRVISEEGLSFYCFRLGLARLRREIRVLTGRNVSSGRLYHHLSEVFWSILQEGYLRRYGVEKLYICRDVEFLFKNKVTYVIGELSQLADPIAWINLRRPPGIKGRVKEEDLRERMLRALISRVKKR